MGRLRGEGVHDVGVAMRRRACCDGGVLVERGSTIDVEIGQR